MNGMVRMVDPGRHCHGLPSAESSTAKIWFDGRVDNRPELLAQLQLPSKCSDAVLVLAACRVWGRDAPARILGDFALAYWDPGARELLCARDRIGVRPFYYAVADGSFLFASEPAELFRHRSITCRPNLAQVGRYLLNDRSEPVETLYEGVLRLAPAHMLRVGNTVGRPERYWDIDPDRQVRYSSEDEYDQHFRTLLQDAVRDRLRTEGRAAAMLSGGLDSSAIVAVAGELAACHELPREQFETWSMLFEGHDCDEREYIEAVSSSTGFRSHRYEFADLSDQADLASCIDDPDIHYSPLNLALRPMLARARDQGVQVMLNGVGGDEFLAPGFHHLADLLRQGRWTTLVKQLRCDAELFHTDARSLLWHDAIRPLTPAPARRIFRTVRQALQGAGTGVGDWILPDFLNRYQPHESRERLFGDRRFQSLEQEALYDGLLHNSNLTVGIGESGLLASRYGIDLRFPFLDSRLVEFLLAIPAEQRWWMDRPKRILRRSLAGILPEKVRARKNKVEFSSVLAGEIEGRMSRLITALLRDSLLEEAGVVDGPVLRNRFADYLAKKKRSENYWVIYNFIGMEIWMRAIAGMALPAVVPETVPRVA